MAIRTRSPRKAEIDLSGPQGNAFYLLGTAARFGKQIGLDNEQIEAIITDMKSGDYEHLIKTFDNHFGEVVDLIR